MALQRILCLGLLYHGVIAGSSGSGPTAPAAAGALEQKQNAAPRRGLHGRFLHITDIHPDEFYKVHSSTDEADGCHKGEGPAGPYGAETTDCDAPYSLVNATFDWIAANLKDKIDFVVWTGDTARHDRDDDLPRTQDQVLGTNAWIADKFAEMLKNEETGHGMSIPVVPTFGNNDILPHNILLPGPNKWLQTYTHIWRHFIPEEQRHSFGFGGWFYVDVIPNRLAVFSLNTLYFFDRNAGVDGCENPSEPGFKQLEWLRVQLEFMRARGMKAILTGHVPPARTDSKKLWDETCWQKYALWLHQYRDVVISGMYGHMNIDHFLIHDTDDVDIAFLEGLSPEFGVREYLDDELTIQAGTDYLMELRDDWSKLRLPPVPGKSNEVNQGGKKGRGRKPKRKDPWGERYVVSLVGPSIVPTYFPTLRVVEYNISGLENTPLWRDMPGNAKNSSHPTNAPSAPQKHLDLRSLPTENDLSDSFEDLETARKKKKKGGKRPKKEKKPHDPNLVIPPPPAKTTPPGPAYSQQPLSLIGYIQYFANLTHINNLNLTDLNSVEPPTTNSLFSLLQSSKSWLMKWRKGKHGGKKPLTPKPDPREFTFEVEYSTFNDKIYKLGDLTVNSFVELAYRIGQRAKGKEMVTVAEDEVEEEEEEHDCFDSDYESDSGSDSDSDDEEMETEVKKGDKKKGDKKKGRKGGKKKKKGKGKKNKTWLHFLNHAFVGTLDKEELKRYS
ncbi:Metallo-dependent phosphatase-like protein [Triangularia verruculosa]|uniref:Endopolyphosphatase n=1 Tax=Triangularia verruculosa TaxID=2587418 RepID=A0AAN6XAC2_9PEZI|nr:Metallo-dependent phosphatase-like protein [Triangularia verruculosa]